MNLQPFFLISAGLCYVIKNDPFPVFFDTIMRAFLLGSAMTGLKTGQSVEGITYLPFICYYLGLRDWLRKTHRDSVLAWYDYFV